MNKIIDILYKIFAKKAILKLLIAAVVLVLSVKLYDFAPVIFDITGLGALAWFVLTFLLFFISGVIGMIRDIKKNKGE